VTTRHPSLSDLCSPDREPAVRAERKLCFLKRAGLFGKNTQGATIKRACTADQLRQAYRLVHDVFQESGYLKPEPSGLRLRMFETSSETATFIAEKAGVVVGVLSVVGDSPDVGLPSDAAFKSELDARRTQGRRLCEITNQAVAPAYRKSAVPTELMRCALAHELETGYDDSVATVSPSHHGFYALLGFDPLGNERSYSTKLYDPVIALLMGLDQFRSQPEGLRGTARFLHHYATRGNKFLSRVRGWGRRARRNFLNADLLEALFVRERNFLGECSAAELQILQHRWGQEMFEAVTGGMDMPARAGRAPARRSR
jgi:ribosomal protein S18 acetylase RimI-like enzyme